MHAFQDSPIMLVGRMNIIEDDVETEIIATIHAPAFHDVLKVWYCRVEIPGLLDKEEIIASEDYSEATHRAIKFIESLGHGRVDAWRVPKKKHQ